MILPCEIAVKSVIPSIRATLAQELVERYSLKQDQVAEFLGISQSAVSKYTRQVRGHLIRIDDVEEIHPLIDKMTRLIINRDSDRPGILSLLCQMCMIIREKGLMCQFCQKTDPQVKIEECNFCRSAVHFTNEK